MFFFFPERRLVGHRQEVCGLKWSPDNQYLASGGNDNKLFVWNSSMTQPVHTFTEHLAAVKAIAWSPHHHGLLASGGGTADRCIRFWNTLTGQVNIFFYLRSFIQILVGIVKPNDYKTLVSLVKPLNLYFLIDFGG